MLAILSLPEPIFDLSNYSLTSPYFRGIVASGIDLRAIVSPPSFISIKRIEFTIMSIYIIVLLCFVN